MKNYKVKENKISTNMQDTDLKYSQILRIYVFFKRSTFLEFSNYWRHCLFHFFASCYPGIDNSWVYFTNYEFKNVFAVRLIFETSAFD